MAVSDAEKNEEAAMSATNRSTKPRMEDSDSKNNFPYFVY